MILEHIELIIKNKLALILINCIFQYLQKKSFDGRWFFKCQKGLTECMKNKWQSCSIHVLPSKLQSLLAQYLMCYMDSTDQSGYQVKIIVFTYLSSTQSQFAVYIKKNFKLIPI